MEYIKGLLSFCCTCYNHEKYIKECIESIWDNDYKDIEIIVIDDGSSDKSVEILKELRLKSPCRFEIIEQANTHNIGLNFNRTISKARGEFITFMSLDDYYCKDAFLDKVNFLMENPKNAFAISKYAHKLINNKFVEGKLTDKFDNITSIDILCEVEYKEGTFALQGNIFRREIIDKVNGFDEDIYGDDIVLRTKVLQYIQKNREWNFKFFDNPSFVYRLHNTNYSSNLKSMANIYLDCYDKYWANKPYPTFITDFLLIFFLKSRFDDFYPIFLKHTRALQMVYSNKKLMKQFKNKLNDKYNIFSKINNFILRKEYLSLNRVRYVLMNSIKINFKINIKDKLA